MRRIAKYLKENKQQFIERVNVTMMDDFAAEFMKTEDDKITISYLIFQYDLDDLVEIDYLFDWETKERVDNEDNYNWYQVDVTVNRDDWEAWDKARECENNFVIIDKRQGIYNTVTGDFINCKEYWDLRTQIEPIHFVRYVVANELKKYYADLRRFYPWVNNSKGKGLEA